MPLVQISMIEGRDAALVSECARQVARTIHQTLGAPMASIRVLVNELPATHWAIGDQTRAEIDAEKADKAAQAGRGSA